MDRDHKKRALILGQVTGLSAIVATLVAAGIPVHQIFPEPEPEEPPKASRPPTDAEIRAEKKRERKRRERLMRAGKIF